MVALVIILIELAILVAVIAGIWKVYEKMGRKGWECLIPIYNIYVLLVVLNKPIWWLVMLIIPIVSIVFAFLLCFEIAKGFGKSTGFGVGLALLGFVFFPILGFGDAEWNGPGALEGFPVMPPNTPVV